MSKRETMPEMMAWKMAPMALTMAMRQAPIDWQMAVNCAGREMSKVRRTSRQGKGTTHAGHDGTHSDG